MALLAETATGAVFGMNVPDTHIPLIKSLHVDYKKRATGGLRAKATLTEEQRREIESNDKGSTVVNVVITDDGKRNPAVPSLVLLQPRHSLSFHGDDPSQPVFPRLSAVWNGPGPPKHENPRSRRMNSA